MKTPAELREELPRYGIRISDPDSPRLRLLTPEEIEYSLFPIDRKIRVDHIGILSSYIKNIEIPSSIVTIQELSDYLNSKEVRVNLASFDLGEENKPFLNHIAKNIDLWSSSPILAQALRQHSLRKPVDIIGKALLLGEYLTEKQIKSLYKELQRPHFLSRWKIFRSRWLSLILQRYSRSRQDTGILQNNSMTQKEPR